MKKTWLIILITWAITAYAGLSMSGETTVTKGKELFNSAELGGSSNQTSCNTCHPDGRGLKNAGSKENLVDMINMCIERPLKGNALETESSDMKSLQLYIKSLKK